MLTPDKNLAGFQLYVYFEKTGPDCQFILPEMGKNKNERCGKTKAASFALLIPGCIECPCKSMNVFKECRWFGS